MLPDVRLTIQKNGLGLLPASAVGVPVKLGVSSQGLVNTLYAFGDKATAQATLGAGPLLEAVCDTLSVAGGPVFAMPVNPSAAGSVGSTTHVGTGSGTVTGSAAPVHVVRVKIETGGVPGTMTFRWSLDGGTYSNPVATTSGTFTYLIPGTQTVITFANQTYTSADVWTFNTDGTSSITGVGTLSWVTQASSPLDRYDVIVTIVGAGALGAATFTYSVDGGTNTSGQVLVPSGGVFVVPGTGVVLTFASTFVADDTYEILTTTAGFSTTDVNNAMTVLLANPAQWGFVHVVGMGTNSAAAAAMAAAVDAQMTTAQTAFRYAFGVVECPQGESDSTIAAAFASFTSDRVMVCVGDIMHISQVSAATIRRNAATVVTSRLSSIDPSIDAGNDQTDEQAALANVASIFRDEFKTPALDAQRFCTLRSEIGESGYFVTNPNMMTTDDFSLCQNRRVMDVACATTRSALLPYLNSRVQVDKTTGTISKLWAKKVENRVQALLKTALKVSPNGAVGDAVDVSVTIDRTANVLSNRTVPVSVGIIPNGYAKFINVTIGFTNPALA